MQEMASSGPNGTDNGDSLPPPPPVVPSDVVPVKAELEKKKAFAASNSQAWPCFKRDKAATSHQSLQGERCKY